MSDNFGDALERARTLYPAREAVVDGDQRWSYAELHGRVAAFDAALDRPGWSRATWWRCWLSTPLRIWWRGWGSRGAAGC